MRNAPDQPQPALEPPGAAPGLPRPLVLLLAAAAIAITAAGLRAAADVVAPIVLALVLTIAVVPVVGWVGRRGWPSWCAALLALVGTCAMLLVLVLGIALPIGTLADLVPQYASGSDPVLDDVEDVLVSLGVAPGPAGTAAAQLDPARLVPVLTGLVEGVLGALGSLFLLVTLLFFTCTALPLAGRRAATLRRAKPAVASSLARFVRTTQRYLVVSALFGGIVAVLDAGALWLLGVPLPLVWGLFSFITNFIPNIGFVLGVIPPALLALLIDGWGGALLVVVVYSTLNVVIQTFVQPRYVASSVGLSAEVTSLSLVVWSFLLGAPGALLAVPMTLLARALLLDPDPRAAWVSPLISTSPDDVDVDAGADGEESAVGLQAGAAKV